MPNLGPAALHVNCRIRGQDLRSVVTNNATASFGSRPCMRICLLASIHGFGRIDSPTHPSACGYVHI